jgi:hypothetical protein
LIVCSREARRIAVNIARREARGGRGLGPLNTIDGIAAVIVIVLLVLLFVNKW